MKEIPVTEQPSHCAVTLKEMQKYVEAALGQESKSNDPLLLVQSKTRRAAASTSSNSITDQILEQVRRLKANNLQIQALTQSDHAVLDETSLFVERGVGGMKRQNAQVAAFLSRAWKHTGMYWMGILVSIMMFMLAFLVIKVFPR